MLLAGKDARDQQELGESPGQTLPRGRRRSQSAGTLTLDSCLETLREQIPVV